MHFFRAREAAESWAEGRTGVAVLTVEEGYELARAHWIERRQGAESRQRIQTGGNRGAEAKR